jgi:GTP cyclohydrolase I
MTAMSTNLSVVPQRSRVTRTAAVRDLDAATRAAGDLLRGLGIDPDDPATPDLAETPRRLALAYAELLDVPEFDFTTFANTEGYDELVLVREIPFQSVCEHHLLPFSGVAHVGYLPRGRIVGLSKLARTVDHYARRPQTQERLTMQVADLLEDQLSPRGVGVLLVAEHTCMTLRGARAPGSATTTSSLRGHLRENAAARAEFLALVNGGPR